MVLQAANTVEFVTTYLGARSRPGTCRCSPASTTHALADALGRRARSSAPAVRIERRGDAAGHVLHPDLALLMSTSGSTGSPKLVRLSHRNLVSNARAIAAYLGLTPADRGITTLPLHYCYGLSVLHSHLAAGAGIVLTDGSVVDPCFAAAMRDGARHERRRRPVHVRAARSVRPRARCTSRHCAS